MIAPRFTVVWQPDVVRGLAAYWVAADSDERRRMTRIVHLIDRVLALAPEKQGELDTADPDIRLWNLRDLPPLVRVAFWLSMDDRLVRVIRITFFDRP